MFHVYQRSVEGGETAAAIADSSGISVAKVHAALACAFANPPEMAERHERAVTEAKAHSSSSSERRVAYRLREVERRFAVAGRDVRPIADNPKLETGASDEAIMSYS